jgi:hypothetical protein
MATPTSREEFKEYCLRRLGKPVIQINVSDDQVEDRVSDALKYYADYHFDGSTKVYYKHQITQEDKDNKYITLPENIIGAVKIFRLSGLTNGNNIFDLRYQIALNDLYTLTSHSMVPYFMTMQHLQLIEEMLVGEKPIRFNRHTDRLHIDMSWGRVDVGSFLIVEAYEVIDPEQFTDVWNDRWLMQYATALIKRQWGENIKKFSGMALPGGQTMNGQKIWEEAVEEIEKLEAEMINSYSLPASIFIG